MTSAVFSGLTQSNQQIKYNCPSGNCTWDTFQSLAICSACIDLTDQLNKVDRFRYRLSNGLTLPKNSDTNILIEWMVGFGTGNESQSMSFGSKDTLIWSMTMIRVLDPGIPNSSVTAAECGLWYCIQNFDSMVQDGNLIERVSLAPSMRLHNSWQPSKDDVWLKWDTHDAWSRTSLETAKHDSWAKPATKNYKGQYTLSFGMSSVDSVTDLQLGDHFNVSQEAVYGISNLMSITFTRSLDEVNMTGFRTEWLSVLSAQADSDFCAGISGNYDCVLPNAFWGTGSNSHTIHAFTAMPYLCYSEDLNATFAAIAKSMTNNIRENSDNNLVAIGNAAILHVMYQVQWIYLILPIFLVIVNAVFFVIVIFHTRKSDLAILCSGAVPTVGLGGNIGPVFNDVRLRSRMEATAKVQQIRFISASKEKRSSHDIEERSSSHENNSVPSSQEDNDVSSYQGSNVVSPLTGTDDHEMAVFMGAGFANQDNARRRSLGE